MSSRCLKNWKKQYVDCIWFINPHIKKKYIRKWIAAPIPNQNKCTGFFFKVCCVFVFNKQRIVKAIKGHANINLSVWVYMLI